MVYKELVYIILDLVKLISDDSIINEDHILFLLNKYRPFLLKQYYDKETLKEIPDINYTEICVDLEETSPINGEPCEGSPYLKSTLKIPNILNLGTPKVSVLDAFQGINIAYVTPNRLKYVGSNKWMRNIIYCTKGYDDYLYLKSNNPQFRYLKTIKFTAVFEDPTKAAELSCNYVEDLNKSCDLMELDFPMEEHLIPQLLELVLKELLSSIQRPADNTNNAADDLSDLHTFIARNVKSNLAKQLSE